MKNYLLRVVLFATVVIATGSTSRISAPLLDGLPAPGCDNCLPLPK